MGVWGDATWREAAALAGAAHVGAARRWLDERPWAGMVPANELASAGRRAGCTGSGRFAATLVDGRLVAYLPSAALLDNGAGRSPRVPRGDAVAGSRRARRCACAMSIRAPWPRAWRSDVTADATGVIVITRTMLAAMPSMEDWVVEAIPG